MPRSVWPRCNDAVLLAPSLLGANFAHLAAAVHALEGSGAERLSINVMDGRFVPNFTFGTDTFRSLRAETRLPFEAHLMISTPERHLETFASAGADGITIHHEACEHVGAALRQIRALNCRAGVAINPETPASAVDLFLDSADLALVMTIHPGFGGQELIPETLNKVRAVRDAITQRGLDIDLEVDGGVDLSTARACVEAGANVLVAGTAVFGASDPAEAARTLVAVAAGTLLPPAGLRSGQDEGEPPDSPSTWGRP
jgi:ribulose-phosphate 3-epimerase